jgi:histidine triad (HIT) family protein
MSTDATGCPFCAIARRQAPADVVFEDDAVIGFLPLRLATYGHTVLVPKAHRVALWDLEHDLLCHLSYVAQQLSIHFRSHIDATGVNLLCASGQDAQQSVPHFHLHLLPRFTSDGLDAWPDLPQVAVDRAELVAKLRLPELRLPGQADVP